MDNLCPGCYKCLHSIYEKDGKFKSLGDEEVKLVFLASCGGCPGLVPIKVDLVNRVLDTIKEKVDIIFIATCMERAVENFNCPMDIGLVKSSLEKAGIKVVIGTHEYPVYKK